MNPNQTPQDLEDERLQNVHNPLKVMQDNERVLCEIQRHPAGLWGLYFSAALLCMMAITGAALIPTVVPDASTQVREAAAFGVLILIAIVGLYTFIARTIYKGNRWVVTSDSITQITQVGLFNKKSSQLNLDNLEDVSADQNGLLQSALGYGTLKVETAGERSKFMFPFCPNPEEYAKKIIAAHEQFLVGKPGEGHGLNTSPAQPYVQQPQQQFQSNTPPVAPYSDPNQHQ
jgi:uncharacterized membrane protein YdbT with pleckstrin-like domain